MLAIFISWCGCLLVLHAWGTVFLLLSRFHIFITQFVLSKPTIILCINSLYITFPKIYPFLYPLLQCFHQISYAYCISIYHIKLIQIKYKFYFRFLYFTSILPNFYTFLLLSFFIGFSSLFVGFYIINIGNIDWLVENMEYDNHSYSNIFP